jgi:hypothetical protein
MGGARGDASDEDACQSNVEAHGPLCGFGEEGCRLELAQCMVPSSSTKVASLPAYALCFIPSMLYTALAIKP